MSDDQYEEAAARWYNQRKSENDGGDRQRMIDRCATYLSERFEITARTAQSIALRMLKEPAAATDDLQIDLVHSTSDVLVLSSADGLRRGSFPVADVVRVLHPHSGRWLGVDPASGVDVSSASPSG